MNFDIPKWLQLVMIILGTAGTGFVFWIGAGSPPLDFSSEEIHAILNIFASANK